MQRTGRPVVSERRAMAERTANTAPTAATMCNLPNANGTPIRAGRTTIRNALFRDRPRVSEPPIGVVARWRIGPEGVVTLRSGVIPHRSSSSSCILVRRSFASDRGNRWGGSSSVWLFVSSWGSRLSCSTDVSTVIAASPQTFEMALATPRPRSHTRHAATTRGSRRSSRPLGEVRTGCSAGRV